MGHVFTVPIVRVKDLGRTISDLRTNHGINSYALVVNSEESNLTLESLVTADQDDSRVGVGVGGVGTIKGKCWCLVVGNEGKGISEAVSKECRGGEIRIGMAGGSGLSERTGRHWDTTSRSSGARGEVE